MLSIALGLVALWAVYLVQQQYSLVSVATAQLAALAEVKAQRAADWREERLADGRSISTHPLIARLAHQIETGGEPERARADLGAWCRSRMQRAEYSRVAVFGAKGDLLATEGIEIDASLGAEVAAGMRARAVELSGLHRDALGAAHVDLLVPLQLEGGARLVGLAVLRIDPQRVLMPVVLGSPLGPTRAETMLLDRSSGELLPLGGEWPGGISRRELRQASEELEGGDTFEMPSATGASLLAALRPVPGSPWSSLVTADRGEALAPLRRTALRSLLIVLIAIGVLHASRAFWFRRRLREFRRRQAAAESAFLDLQSRYEAISKHATDAILLADGDCRIVQANDRALELYGMPRPDLVGRNIRDLLEPGSTGDQELRKLQVDVEGAAHFETRHRRLDGTVFPVEILAHAVEVDGKRYYQTIVHDTTERRRAEEALRASEEKFRSAFFEAPVGTALVDREGRFIEFNAALARMLGRSPEELKRLRFGELVHPDDRTASLVAFGRLVSGERDHNDMDRRYLRGNGEVLHARYSVSALRDLSGRFLWAMAIVQDVTAQVMGERALRASDERFRLALEATDDGIWDWDIPGDSLHVSERWLSHLGYRLDEITNMQSVLALVHEEDRPAFMDRIQANLDGRASSFEAELRFATREREWRWVVIRGRIVKRDATGKPLRAVGSQTDVTERKRLQTSLHLADRLATVGSLAAGAAHEINGPLTQVMSNVERVQVAMARHHSPDGTVGTPGADVGDARRALEDALEGIGHVARIVQDLSTFSRSDDQRSSVDVRRAVESAIRFAMPAISGRARLLLDFQDTPLVAGAEGRLSQVFLSLLVNAGQAIPTGHPDQNEVSVRIVATDDRQVRVEIRDTGCGIPAEGRTRIFDPFFTTKPVGKGTGLGLSLSYSIVQKHHGHIDVSSEVGKGTTFRVWLPIRQPESAAAS
jgi:PAS domain S-box-containing protein